MLRKPRVQHPSATYHVMICGDRWEDILLTDVDRKDSFIAILPFLIRSLRD